MMMIMLMMMPMRMVMMPTMKTLSNIPRQDLSFFITLGVMPNSFSYLQKKFNICI